MVRTKSMMSRRISMGKSPNVAACKAACSGAGSSGSSSATTNNRAASTPGKNKYSGGNPVCPRETPAWQKEITCFFPVKNDHRPPAEDDDDDDDVESPTEPGETMLDEAGPSGS